jgi:hypothetical protein
MSDENSVFDDGVAVPAVPGAALAERGTYPPRVLSADFGAQSMQHLLHFAIERGTPVEQLEKLVDLADRMERRQAERDFAVAMAAFQAECPSIKKGSRAKVATKGGGSYSYTYAELDDIARVVNPILARHGLSYSWDSTVDRDILTCLCTVRHLNGHSVTSRFTLPVENPSAMNPQQKVGAALTFAERRSLSAVLGLTTTNDDTDANPVDPTPINEDQVTELEDLIRETDSNRQRFLDYMGVESMAAIQASDYQRGLKALEQRAKKRGRT